MMHLSCSCLAGRGVPCEITGQYQIPKKSCPTPNRCLPYFVILGPPKTGTSFLTHHLNRHPQIMSSFTKEPGFFDSRPPLNFSWYLEQFPTTTASDAVVTFEATSRNLLYPHIIKDHLPDARFILILRDPAERLYSHYGMSLRRTDLDPKTTLQQFTTPLHNTYVSCERKFGATRLFPEMVSCLYRYPKIYFFGCYDAIIKAWRNIFRQNLKLLILTHEEVTEDTAATLDRITDFLEVSRCNWEGSNFTAVNKNMLAYRNAENDKFMPTVRHWYRHGNRELELLLQRKFDWKTSPKERKR